jgi:hypothetical protein
MQGAGSSWAFFLAAVLAAVLAALAAVVAARLAASRGAAAQRPATGAAPSSLKGGRLTTRIVVPLARDQYRSAYWAPAYIAGESVRAIADTGSSYFVVPRSLPCPRSAQCALTGARTRITYGDGTTDDAVFTASRAALGGNPFPALVFGGSSAPGTGSASADDPILGLAPLKAPRGFASPVGRSVVEQIGAAVLEFDLRDEFNASLALGPAGARPPAGGALAAEAPLAPRGQLWTVGVDHETDFYVVRLPAGQSPALGGLKFLILDTGTTQTLLPAHGPGAVSLKFPTGRIPVRAEHLGVLPPMYQGGRGQALNAEVGILGNRTMTGYRVVIDAGRGVCRFYR